MKEDEGDVPAVSGSCACGGIKFIASSPPSRGIGYCYCKTCQKISGAPFCPFLELPKDSLKWITSKPAVFRKSQIAERLHCPTCGSTLGMQYHCEPENVSVTAAAIDQAAAPLGPPGFHIFVTEKPSWYQIPEDGLPRYDHFTPGFQPE